MAVIMLKYVKSGKQKLNWSIVSGKKAKEINEKTKTESNYYFQHCIYEVLVLV